MNLLHLLLAGLGVFALLQFLAIPLVRHRLRIDRTLTAIPRAALLAVLGWVRGVVLVATLTTAALLLVVTVLGQLGGATAADLVPVIATLHAWRDWLVGFGPYWGSAVLLLLVLGLGIHAYRSSKRRMETAFRRVYEQEMERIRQQIDNGTLQDLPPTPAMERMAENARKIFDLLQQLQNDPNVPASERPRLRAHLEQQLGLCRQYWIMLDVERRMNLKLDPDDAELPTPRTRWEKVQTFFMSQGLLACLGRGSRALYLASLLLLVPCLMGVYSPKIVGDLEQRALSLDDLRVRLHCNEALGEWHRAEEGLASEQQSAEVATLQRQHEEEANAVAAWHQEAGAPAAQQTAALNQTAGRHATETAAQAQRHAADLQALRERQAAESRLLEQSPQTAARRQLQERLTSQGTLSRQMAEEAQAFKKRQAAGQAAFEQRLTDSRLDFQAGKNRQTAGRQWQDAKAALGPPGAAVNEADRLVLLELVLHYERDLGNLDLVRETQTQRPSSFELRAQATREAILKRGVEHAPAAEGKKLLHQHPAGSQAPNLAPGERFVAQAYEKAADAHGPQTAVGRLVLAELEDAASRSPGLVQRLRQELAAFQRAATGRQLGNELATQILVVLVGEHPDAGLLLQGVNRQALGAMLEPVLEARSNRFLLELARGSPLPDALRAAQREDPARPLLRPAQMAELKQTMRTVVGNLPPEQQVLAKMASHPPSVDVHLERHVDVKRVSSMVEGLKERGTLGEAVLPRLAEPVTTYRDEFPSHLSAPRPTVRAELESKLIPKEWSVPAPAAGRPLPSRNIDALRRLPRVGGVLIGQEPAADSTLNLVDLRWEVSGPSVRLVLVGADRQEFRSRSYPRSLVYHALNYAADGRKVAVTICEAYPLKEHSILLHPTLVDTPLGSRVIELDQLINRFAGEDPLYKKLTQEFQAQMALYRWAWAKRILALGDSDIAEFGRVVEDKHRADFLKGAEHLRESARQVVAADPKGLAEAFAARGSLGDPQRCPLTAQRQYFEEKLVQRLLTAAGPARTFDDFDRAFTSAVQAEARELLEGYRSGWQLINEVKRQVGEIKRRADSEVESARFPGANIPQIQARLRRLEQEHNAAVGRIPQGDAALKDNYRRFATWLMPPPRYGLRNIVKERPFKAKMSQLVVADGAEAPTPFDFFLQMVFTDQPAFGEKNGHGAASANDGWWVFTALTDTIQARVREGVAHDEKARRVLTDVTEFTQLQRLVQAALLGRLGKEFPVEKLVALADATAPGLRQTPTRTLRWDLREGRADIVRGLEAASLLNHAFRQLDPTWDPVLFQKTDSLALLDSPDLAVALEEWPAALLQRLEPREGGSTDGGRWCLETTRTLKPYFALLAESVRKHQAFRKAAVAMRERAAKAVGDAEKTEWRKAREEFLDWKKGWARKWEETRSRHTLSRPPKGLTRQASDKGATPIEQIEALVRLMEETSAALEIRQAVDVARDEWQALEELILPLPGLD
jgi:hypothetical protein